ncbi:PTS system galactosamine-specific IID component [Breznakia sp. PF5-3]|uniref:PTS system mannose/fructose/sorbose family transporter subunit IID n=1 Tax=unclassified Breznakia TaxID=2623764 RepID=UPI002405C5BF|nr:MULTISPECIES: PTS system mannose/fructose/sorbose family transporter subunit IID [unclassified Breznakia]MDF9824761.1 PTS system galactosamine-specific IID component [Breznakia sp. PM6-1]MDF9835672.1 PTS system galactosamine-specific IID component [Breznakia sp. PF5-3]MDF9837721.1 PTS system galactosamine-specific IID component [Breznakia sp. PFB2-8]MDF9859682.1 PTS system galactosamine-specific IID component [Breznakia sp. PH5-24]
MASSQKRGKLTKKDITRMGLYSIIEQSAFSFERMQAPGFTLSMLPAFKKIYGDSKEDLAEFMTYNMEFMNTEPHMATFLMGLILSMEENGEDRKLIEGIRNGLFGPFAGLGDAIFWFTLLPISAAICCSLAQDGSVLGPILYIVIWFIAAISRVFFARFGYNLGVKAVSRISESTKYLTKAAGILGVMVVGGLIPSYINVAFSENLKFGLGEGTTVQSVFDNILPNILPLAFVFLIYWLFKKKNGNVLIIILGIIAFSIAMSFLGWM